MKVESIAECSLWSILQFFWPALSDSWSSLLSGCLRQILLYNQQSIYIYAYKCLCHCVGKVYNPKCQLWLVWYAWAHYYRKWPTIFCSLGHFGPPIVKKKSEPLEYINRSVVLLSFVRPLGNIFKTYPQTLLGQFRSNFIWRLLKVVVCWLSCFIQDIASRSYIMLVVYTHLLYTKKWNTGKYWLNVMNIWKSYISQPWKYQKLYLTG